MIKISCCQYQIENLSCWDSYVEKIENLVIDAKKDDATILLMPEYAGIEIACKKFNTDHELFTALQPLIPKYIKFYQQLAHDNKIYILPGTITVETSPHQFVNRAYIFSPNNTFAFQDKLQLTEYEKKTSLIYPSNMQTIFVTTFAKIGIAICYDSEFPEIIRRLVTQGVSIILVPSYTTTLAAYHRVFLSCRARAIENQCYVGISYVVNKVDVSGECEDTYGRAAILGPADVGFSNNGIIAQGKMNQAMLINSCLSLEALELVRNNGQVHNFKDSMQYHQGMQDQMISSEVCI